MSIQTFAWSLLGILLATLFFALLFLSTNNKESCPAGQEKLYRKVCSKGCHYRFVGCEAV